MNERGIILLAAGHAYYGNYAFTLAVSIKNATPDIPISILVEGAGINHLPGHKLAIFDKIIHVDKECYTCKNSESRDIFKIKTCLYDLSPYKETLYFDVDMLWLPRKSVHQLFDEFKDCDFSMSNRGSMSISDAKHGFIQWANPEHIKAAYGFTDEKIYNASSEVIYFKKDKSVKKLFTQAKKNFDFPKVNYQIFGDNQPDELSFIIAMMQTGIYPHKDSFFPAYWEHYEKKNMSNAEMYQKFYLASFGGSIQSNSTHQFYNNLAKYYLNKNGERHFPSQNKRDWATGRTHI